MASKLIGLKAHITDKDSQYYGEWGTITHFDGDCYHIAIANGTNSVPMFDRNQFRVKRNAL